MSSSETINHILQTNCSISRFGDGELKLMQGKAMPFEDPTQENAGLLRKAFATSDPRVLICLTKIFDIRSHCEFTSSARYYYKNLLLANYEDYRRFFNFKYRYGNALITRFYLDNKDKRNATIHKRIAELKRLWDQRNIIFVEGMYSKLGVGNDLFDNAKSIRRIICPERGALQYRKIIESAIVKAYRKDDLIILALGPAASYLSAIVPIKYGIQCLDLGHIDVEYIWWVAKVDKKTLIEGKHAAEAKVNPNESAIVLNADLSEYQAQIIDKIC